jgi:hypothetical protein
MKKLSVGAFFTIFVCLGLVQTAAGTQPTLGVYFDAAGTQRTLNVTPLTPFDFYVVAHDPEGGINGYEFQVDVPLEISVVNREMNPLSGINFGSGDNWIVGTGVCLPETGTIHLVRYTAFLIAPLNDVVIKLAPSNPSSFSPEAPGYVSCLSPSDIHPFECWQYGLGGEAIVNPVALTPSSCSGSPAGPPTLGVFFDPTGTQRTLDVIPLTPFDFYVVADNTDGGILGYEFQLSIPPELVVLDRVMNPPSSINVGSGDNWIVGTGVCLPGTGKVDLVRYTVMLIAFNEDLVIELLPATPSSFSPESPGYVTCLGTSDIRPFECWETWGGGEAIVNPVAFSPSVCPPAPGPPPTLGVYFNPAGTQRITNASLAVPFEFYVVAHNANGGILGYEFTVDLPMEMSVIDRTYYPPAGVNVGSLDNWIVGTGECLPGSGPVVLVRYTVQLNTVNQDIVVGLLPAVPTSFPPGSPGYVTCLLSGDLHPFQCWETGVGGEAIVNPFTLTPSSCPASTPPVAVCADKTVTADANCVADASIDDGSYDPHGESITVEQTPPGPYPLGTTTVTLTVTDASGLTDQCTADVTVVDLTPPDVTVSFNRDCLWPPNHKMADIFVTLDVTDNCCAMSTVELLSVTSDEAEDGKGDGRTKKDIKIVTDTHVQLRSERNGPGDGRVYTFTYRATDCHMNATTVSEEVRVPHDREGGACASLGFTPDGTTLDPEASQFTLVIRSSVGFDATALDVTKTYVGNILGVMAPERSLEIDNNADGLLDLAVFYPSRSLGVLLDGGSVGLHYTSEDGVDYLVSDIFGLGEPVPLKPPLLLPKGMDEGLDGAGAAPGVTALLPSYPNPFNPSTTIPFNLVSSEHVTIRIYNLQGALVRTLKNESFPPGLHRVIWDGRDKNNQEVATGAYFVRFTAGSVQTTQKLVLIR